MSMQLIYDTVKIWLGCVVNDAARLRRPKINITTIAATSVNTNDTITIIVAM